MNLFGKELLIVKVEDDVINIVHSRNKKIYEADKILIDSGKFSNGEILDTQYIIDKINFWIENKKVNCDGIIFTINGLDIVIRHTEIPIMEQSDMINSVKWEMTQYLPNQGENHYIDYEIIGKENSEENKVYNVLICAVPKKKVDGYKLVADGLNLSLLAVEIECNCIARIFGSRYVKNTELKDIGIIKFGLKTSEFIILKNGKLFFEREIPFGEDNIIKKLMDNFGTSQKEAENLIHRFNINNINETDDKSLEIKKLVDSEINSFEKFIQFYFTGKTKKNLDKIYVIGSDLNGLTEYFKNVFSSDVDTKYENIFNEMGISYRGAIDFNDYTFALGVIKRGRKDNFINLAPDSMKSVKDDNLKKIVIYAVSSIVGVMVLIVLALFIYCIKLKYDYKYEQTKLVNYNYVQRSNEKLKGKLALYNNTILQYDKIKNKDDYTAKWIKGLGDYVTQDIKIISISKINNVYTIIGNAQVGNSPAVFTANLQESSNYSDAKLKSVQGDDNNSYKFTIEIGDVSK
ncbi:MAG: pilus assembly protein PilM [Clostridium sp.]|nr:pilus assembly protein PilM [Clostridium sp.]